MKVLVVGHEGDHIAAVASGLKHFELSLQKKKRPKFDRVQSVQCCTKLCDMRQGLKDLCTFLHICTTNLVVG